MTDHHKKIAQIVADRMAAGEKLTASTVIRDFKVGNAQAYAVFEAARERHTMWMLSRMAPPVIRA